MSKLYRSPRGDLVLERLREDSLAVELGDLVLERLTDSLLVELGVLERLTDSLLRFPADLGELDVEWMTEFCKSGEPEVGGTEWRRLREKLSSLLGD